MNKELSLRQRLQNLNQKYGYAKTVAERLAAKGEEVTERHIYLVVHGHRRRFSAEIELEVERFVIEREKYEAKLRKEREELQAA